MSIIAPTNKDIQNPHTKKKFSATLRLWHWVNLIIISGSLLTVLINSTILKSRNSGPTIKTELQKDGLNVTDTQARSAAHALSDKVWDIHVYFGYALVALFLFRLVLEFFQLADQKFIRVFKRLLANYYQTPQQRKVVKHELTVKIIYSFFYLLLLIMVITGLFLAFEDFFAPYKAIRGSVKSVHNFCMYLILAFIVIHLTGVFLAERGDSKGIVSDMINGGEE